VKARPSLPLAAALVTFAFHLIANPHYGFFRDELYFIICGFHPQWGYVDQPPVVPLLAAGTQLFGHSLFLLRAVPAAFAGASVYVICLLAIELGGGTFANLLAAVAGALAPVLVAFGEKQGTDMPGLLLWPLAALYVVRIAKGGDERQWIGVGAAMGVCLMSKYSTLFFAASLLAGLLLTPQRRILASKWFAAAAGLAVLIALPNFIWQGVHGFPMLELLRAGQAGKNVVLSPLQYVLAEILITNPLLSIVWICGLVWLLLTPGVRFLAFAYIVLIAAMVLSHGKHYYPADVYPILFAAGGVAIERWTARALVARPIAVALALFGGLLTLPYVEPILPEESFISFNKAVGPRLGLGVTVTEHLKQTWMTQDWADMHGWIEMAALVERVYDALPPDERAHAVAFAQNYGEASAIAFFSHVPVVSGHNQWYLWGPAGHDADVMIDVNGPCWKSMHLYRSAARVATFTNPYAMPYESDLPIFVCRGITKPLQTVWDYAKHYE
jgi:hypothetical protein